MPSAPVSNADPRPSGPLTAPDERFWRRYSPHSEFPLSSAGSVAVHLLALGGLLLFGFYLAYLDKKSDRTLPVEPVRLEGLDGPPDQGAQGREGGRPEEDVGPGEGERPAAAEKVERAPLTKVERKEMKEKFDREAWRHLTGTETDNARAFVRLQDDLRLKLKPSDGPGPKARPGLAAPGPRKGSPRATLTQREKRMLRWTMRFKTSSGADYVQQLAKLGAVLAIPVSDDPEPELKIVRDLRPGAKLLDEKPPADRIYWIDDNPKTVQDVMKYLKAPLRPSRFVAFMPKELEDELFKLEKEHMQRVLRVKYDEERIYQTIFHAVPDGRGGYKPQVVSMKLKAGR